MSTKEHRNDTNNKRDDVDDAISLGDLSDEETEDNGVMVSPPTEAIVKLAPVEKPITSQLDPGVVMSYPATEPVKISPPVNLPVETKVDQRGAMLFPPTEPMKTVIPTVTPTFKVDPQGMMTFPPSETVKIAPAEKAVAKFDQEDYLRLVNNKGCTVHGQVDGRQAYLRSLAKFQTEQGMGIRNEGQELRIGTTDQAFIPVPEEVISARVNTINKVMDKTLHGGEATEGQNNIDEAFFRTQLPKNVHILEILPCVAIYNAPMTNERHTGRAYLLLTKTRIGDTDYYRFYFFSRKDATSCQAEEDTFTKDTQHYSFFDEESLMVVKQGYTVESDINYTTKSTTDVVFLTFAMEDVLSVHHRSLRYASLKHMQSFAHTQEEMTKCCSWGPWIRPLFAWIQWCCYCLCQCRWCWSCCSCWEDYVRLLLWKWSMEDHTDASLEEFISRTHVTTETVTQGQMFYDPTRQQPREGTLQETNLLVTRTLHALNFVCINITNESKADTMIIVDPSVSYAHMVQFVIRVTQLIDTVHHHKMTAMDDTMGGAERSGILIYRKWMMTIRYSAAHLFSRLAKVIPEPPPLTMEALMTSWMKASGIRLAVDISWGFFLWEIAVLIAAIVGAIALIVVIAVVNTTSSSQLAVIATVFSVVHAVVRVYLLRQRQYTQCALWTDTILSVIGVALGIAASVDTTASTASSLSHTSGGVVGVVFLYLQSAMAIGGGLYQYGKHAAKVLDRSSGRDYHLNDRDDGSANAASGGRGGGNGGGGGRSGDLEMAPLLQDYRSSEERTVVSKKTDSDGGASAGSCRCGCRSWLCLLLVVVIVGAVIYGFATKLLPLHGAAKRAISM